MIKVEELDREIEGKLGENDQEKNELASVRIRLAVNKNILAMKIDSIESYQAKYSDIMSMGETHGQIRSSTSHSQQTR